MRSDSVYLIGSCIIAAAIGFHAFATGTDHFAIANVSPGVVARIDTRNGSMEFCGEAMMVTQLLMPATAAAMDQERLSPEVRQQMTNSITRALYSSHCMFVGDIQDSTLALRR